MGRVGAGTDLEEDVEVDDRNARWVLFCLGHFCTLYGEAFMIYQYLPFVEKVVRKYVVPVHSFFYSGQSRFFINT